MAFYLAHSPGCLRVSAEPKLELADQEVHPQSIRLGAVVESSVILLGVHQVWGCSSGLEASQSCYDSLQWLSRLCGLGAHPHSISEQRPLFESLLIECVLASTATMRVSMRTEDIPVEAPQSPREILLMGAVIPPVTFRTGGTLLGNQTDLSEPQCSYL